MPKQNIMKKQLLIPILLFSVFCSAQQSFNASGGNATGSSGKVSFSIGQPFYHFVSNANSSVLEGVQQPFEISTLGLDDYQNIRLEMKVYPNPTSSVLFLNVGESSLSNLEYQLYDASGRLISKNSIANKETKIDIATQSFGVYHLIVLDSSKALKTFKIIKN